MLSIKEINDYINKYYDNNIFEELNDINLLEEYKKSESTKKFLNIFKQILNDNIEVYNDKIIDNINKKEQYSINDLEKDLKNLNIKNDFINKCLNDIITPFIIKPGLKGVIKGNKFNNIVKNYILKLNLNKNIYEIKFETKCEINTTEIPDFYIKNKNNNKIIIGMNQLDLWNGGQQLNRAGSYILNNKYNNTTIKLLCIICNKIKLNKENTKLHKIFSKGLIDKTICYLNDLNNIVNSFFN